MEFTINHSNDEFTIVIVGENLGNELTVSDCKFSSGDKAETAKSMQCYLSDGTATISAVFSSLPEGENSALSLNVNGNNLTLRPGEDKSQDKAITTEVMPQYPGGEVAIMKAVMDKVTFPDSERKWKQEADGVCVVSFTVNADGTIGNEHCSKTCGYGDLDQIAIDVEREGLTEKWTPGTVNGKPVAVNYAITVRFKQQ